MILFYFCLLGKLLGRDYQVESPAEKEVGLSIRGKQIRCQLPQEWTLVICGTDRIDIAKQESPRRADAWREQGENTEVDKEGFKQFLKTLSFFLRNSKKENVLPPCSVLSQCSYECQDLPGPSWLVSHVGSWGGIPRQSSSQDFPSRVLLKLTCKDTCQQLSFQQDGEEKCFTPSFLSTSPRSGVFTGCESPSAVS